MPISPLSRQRWQSILGHLLRLLGQGLALIDPVMHDADG